MTFMNGATLENLDKQTAGVMIQTNKATTDIAFCTCERRDSKLYIDCTPNGPNRNIAIVPDNATISVTDDKEVIQKLGFKYIILIDAECELARMIQSGLAEKRRWN